jgi:two-component system sensor histidine kinase QseC
MPEYQRLIHAEYFQVQFPDGTVYVESQSLQGKLLPTFPADGNAHDLILPTGRMGRVVTQKFLPRPEDEIEPLPKPLSEIPHIAAGQQMMVTMARDRAELDGALRELTECVVFSALGLAVITAAAAIWIVHQSLLPLRGVAQAAGEIETTHLEFRFPETGLPSELQPICSRLNDLLSRIDQAFRRERRFTADVAHELRTPIAELRSVTEIAMRWPDDVAGARQAVIDSHAIARQMEVLVSTLLSMVRSNCIKPGSVQNVPVALNRELKRICELLEPSASNSAIQIESAGDVFVMADPILLGSVLTNLLSNAKEYRTPGSAVICRIDVAGDRCELCIENHVTDLTAEDVTHMFEPFWRKDRSRTGTVHSGLGLSLVCAFCEAMGLKPMATLIDGSALRMMVTFTVARMPIVEAPPTAHALV